MNSQREFEGKDVSHAVEVACSKLGISKNNLKYDIISNGSSGIFSIIGRKKAKIRVKNQTTEKSISDAKGVSSLVDEAFGISKPVKSKPKKEETDKEKQPKPLPKVKIEPEVEPEPGADIKTTDENQEANGSEDPRYDYKSVDVTKIFSESELFKGKSAVEIGIDVIHHIANLITSDTTVTYVTEYDNITFSIEGGNSAVLIGKRGQTLEAIQYIVDKVVNKHCEQRVRIQIDVEGYLETRKDNLQKLALKMSLKAKKTGKPSTINQMSAHDRRIVHLALKEDKSVRTQSMGEGYYRRLVIFPKNRRVNKKKIS